MYVVMAFCCLGYGSWIWSFLQNTFWNVFTSITSVILPLKEVVLQTKYYSSKAMLLNDSSSRSQSSKNSPWSCGTNRPMIFHSVLLINALQKTVVCKSLEASHKWLTHCVPCSDFTAGDSICLINIRKYIKFVSFQSWASVCRFLLNRNTKNCVFHQCTLDNETSEKSIHRNGSNKALLYDAS